MPDDHKELKNSLRWLAARPSRLSLTPKLTLTEAADLIESLEEERDEAVDLLEVERKEPSSIAKAEEFAAGFKAGKAEVDPSRGGDLREAVTELQAAIFVGGPPPTEQEKALNRVAEVAESLARKADRDAAVLEALTSYEAIAALYSFAPNLETDDDAGPNDEEEADLKLALEEVRKAALQHAQERSR